jgi:hypothetical protein
LRTPGGFQPGIARELWRRPQIRQLWFGLITGFGASSPSTHRSGGGPVPCRLSRPHPASDGYAPGLTGFGGSACPSTAIDAAPQGRRALPQKQTALVSGRNRLTFGSNALRRSPRARGCLAADMTPVARGANISVSWRTVTSPCPSPCRTVPGPAALDFHSMPARLRPTRPSATVRIPPRCPRRA